MKQINFNDIDILSFGNDITMKGMVMEGKNDETYLVLLPMDKIKGDVAVVMPTDDEWYQMQDQMDKLYVKGDEGTLLRKGQRVLDQRICWAVYRRDKFKCRYCNIDNVPMTVDHIITWESGGATHEDNLLCVCRKCNKRRGNLDYGSWLEHKYYLKKAAFLPEEIKKKNEEIVFRLNTLPRVSGALRSR